MSDKRRKYDGLAVCKVEKMVRRITDWRLVREVIERSRGEPKTRYTNVGNTKLEKYSREETKML